ncbi:MAG: phenylalanine--tRNA ligase subunit alpha, partial [Thaumarchaeota archaeon]|nr:phenylalanine--tRNA ligase subunit alpha [Nitrososphaerota archaeon]
GQVSYNTLSNEELSAYKLLKRRPDYVSESETKITEIELSQQGLTIIEEVMKQPETERAIDVTAPAPVIYAGRKHPLQDVVDEVREVFVGLGFQEIEGPMVQNSFWNFDALFTPQDHPAREMQDTFYIASMQASSVADKKIVNNVSGIHKKGWGYKWNINDARKLVLRTHTTPVTIRYLADNKPDEDRVFSVGRVFRNEKLTYKHLAEFYQVEGIVVGRNVTLRDLMGLQTEFYSKMGLKKVKFWPSFFPYTEPSLQSMVYHERLGKWVELFGMGIFRPEVTIPIGVKNPVLAWGGGLERIAMLRYELDDVRELYNNKLSWLRSVPKCQL